MAETYFIMGNKEKGEMLFRDYLKADPEWSWGWIGWSDQYWLLKKQDADYKRGEEILFKALTIPGLRDKEDVEERLLDLYYDSGEEEKYKALEKKINNTNNNQKEKESIYSSIIKRAVNPSQNISFKVGRNEACPCGSGKKYKKLLWIITAKRLHGRGNKDGISNQNYN